ncbi:MAG TPA: ATP-grasp domain-containing protein [Actinomycetota bacterium]
MARILLLLPATAYRADDFLEAAEALGVEVVVASDRRSALAAQMEDRALTVPMSDPDAAAKRIERFGREHQIDAVVPVDDRGVVVAAVAAQRLDLPHNPQGAATAATDKVRMRRALAAAGVPQPAFRVLGPEDAAGDLADELGYPVVLKPVSLSMSRGVLRADSPREARAAAGRIREILARAREDPLGPLLVERYVPGPEMALEGLLLRGDVETLALFDKPEPMEGPTFEETIYVTPSREPFEMQDAVRTLVAGAAKAMGLREGPIHAEVRLGPSGPVVLEVAARSIGGLCSRSLRFGAGISLEEVILRHALGLPTDDLHRESAASGVLMLPVPSSGTLVEVRGQDQARGVPGIEGVTITIPPGGELVPLPEGDRYLGFVFARAETPDEVESALREARERLEPIVE